jgi:ABC-type cobalt transport system substrate-binding protein
MILEGKITLTGVHRPIMSEVYEPILSELESLGIKLEDRIVTL